ncbi:Adhesion domain [Syntrophomonas zehnderi OL-4]|uniref:Adhesion domain n=1 Tax=Syntrophomonas zehnderi OL-4 TaxID=690567 RepID=A0A0E4GEG6_9FIRM|nr:collagen binding domain-containing protein [Syntrophomonas zehnderi]CFX88696.1 Adhesion domain [Syntrophomonas zehnderi OL-4]
MRYFYAQRRHRIGMVILLAFLLQIPLSAYSAFSYADTGSVVSTDVIEKITATKDGVELKDIENYRPVMGDEIDLRFDFTLPDKHPYEAGSTLTYTLPAPLKPANGSGELSNEAGETYATYGISEGNVVITFNENIRFQGEEGSGGLETKGWFEITAIFEADENNTALEQELTLPGSGTITLIFQPPGGEVIAKGVAPENSGNSSSYVQWTVDVNTVMDDLGGGKEFTDTLIGNHQYDPTSLKVTRLELGNDGSILSSRDVTEDYPQLAAGATSFTLNLTGKYAYKIEYRTIPGDTEDASQTIKNQAKFNGKTDSKSTTVTYGDPLAKTVSKSGETANWEIKVNGNRKNLAAGTTITDSWNSGKHALVPGTFKVNGSTDLPLGLTVVHSDQGFVLTLGQDINEEFTITYSTQPKDLVTENSDVTNEVKRSDREDKKTITAQYRQNVLSKTNSNINYQEKTVDWKIVLNSAGYNMAYLVLEDTFVHKNLKIVDGTFKVQMNGKDLPYTRTDKDGDVAGDKKGGFTLNIPGPITAPVTVTYTTEYDVRGVDNLDKYANTVGLTWQTNDKEYSTTDVTSTVTINPQQKGKGYKTGKIIL